MIQVPNWGWAAKDRELPEGSHTVVVVVIAAAVDAEAPRRKPANNQGIVICIFLETTGVRQRVISIQTRPATDMVQ